MRGARSDILNRRWDHVLAIPALQKQHIFKTSGQSSLLIGRFASDIPLKDVSFAKPQLKESNDENNRNLVATESEPAQFTLHNSMENEPTQLIYPEIWEWVVVRYDGSLFPGEVKAIGDQEVQVAVMIPAGSHYKWPQGGDCIFYKLTDVVRRKLSPPIVKSARGTFDFTEKW